MALEYYFRYPFAVSGDKAPIAEVIQPDGTVSWQQGYSVDYQLDPATNPLAKNIDRLTYNGSLYQITRAVQEYQQTGNPDWITPAQNGGTPYAYALNAVVRYDDGSGVKLYRNTVAGNTNAPDVSGWVDAAGTPLSDALPIVNGTAAAGVGTSASRADHVHPTDLTRAPLNSPALTGTPTAPTPAAGDNSNKLATTAFLAGQVASTAQAQAQTADGVFLSPLKLSEALKGGNQSLSTSGYQKLPGGLIVQWGLAYSSTTGTAVTFPVTFPNAVLSCVVSAEYAAAAAFAQMTTRPTVSGVTVVLATHAGTIIGGSLIDWVALGY